MEDRPYTIIWENYPNERFKVSLPTYFSNFKYIKIKVKEIFTDLDRWSQLDLWHPYFPYDKLEGLLSYNTSGRKIINLLRYLKSGHKFPSFQMPYRKDIEFQMAYDVVEGKAMSTIGIVIEFTPIN